MADIDFSGLMGTSTLESKDSSTSIDFSGLMNSGSTEVEPVEQSESYTQKVLDAPELVADLIDKRGTLWGQYTADTSNLGYGKAFLQNIALPGQMIESGLSNPVIEMKNGNKNPIELLSESAKGFAGLKRGEYGDVPRLYGAPENVSAGLGLGFSFVLPLALLKIGKNLSAVTKFADKKIVKSISEFTQKVSGSNKINSGNKLVDTIGNFYRKMRYGAGAMNRVGGKVGAYYDDIGNVAVNQSKFLDELSNMTTSIKKSVTDLPVGKMKQVDDELFQLVEKGDIYSVHRAKEVVDDLITNYFTSTSKAQSALKTHSRNLGNIIDEAALKSKSQIIGEKAAKKYVDKFKKARKDYSVLKNGYGSIQKKLINPNTGEPTRTGRILSEINDNREIDLRQTLRAIDKYGTDANKFARELESIEKAIEVREFAGSAIKSAGRGLVIGVTAGQILKKKDDESFNFSGGN